MKLLILQCEIKEKGTMEKGKRRRVMVQLLIAVCALILIVLMIAMMYGVQ